VTIAVILILGLIWAAVLIPPILRARASQPHSDSVGDFHHKHRMLGHTNGSHRKRYERRTSPTRPMFAPTSRGPGRQSATQKRRRDVLLILLGVCAGTLLLALLTRMPLLFAAHLVADIALGGYVYLLLQYKQRTAEQHSKVRYHNPEYRAPAPYLAGNLPYDGTSQSSGPRLVPLRRTASN
jgi:hypothetical protein